MSSLKELFNSAELLRGKVLIAKSDELLERTILAYIRCEEIVQRIGIFSANETLEDIITSELKYFVLSYHLATLYSQKAAGSHRAEYLRISMVKYKEFLKLCLQYNLVPKDERKYLQLDSEHDPSQKLGFTQSSDRRTIRIQRYKLERELQRTIDDLSQKRVADVVDEERSRKLELALLRMAVSSAVQELESSEAELQILAAIAHDENNKTGNTSAKDSLERPRSDELDWRLDIGKENFLSDKGQVLSPFIITSKREQLRNAVRGYDHSLPSMSIDEYLAWESTRGGILPVQSNSSRKENREEINDDTASTEQSAEEARVKATAWDDFVENNPKGIGNTMNRG